MVILEQLSLKTFAFKIQFLVIGGHALNCYKVSRFTGDLDLAVEEKDVAWWKTELQNYGYKIINETKVFIQFSHKELGVWSIDLMIFDSPTFEKLYSNGSYFRFGTAECKVPSIFHLIALKLHAHSQEPNLRIQDIPDIINLIRNNDLRLEMPELQEVFNKFATPELYEEIKRKVS